MIDNASRNFALLGRKLGHLWQSKRSNKLDWDLKLRLDVLTGFTFLTIVLIPLLTIVFVPLAWGVKNLPAPQGLINDFAGIIASSYEEKMDLLAHEVLNKTGATLTVVTFKDIGGANIDEFTNRLYEAWGVGKKGEDKGVMILLALKERKVRIEVGYGLEGIIPDGLAGQILDEAMIPYLKKGEYGLGLLNGLYATASIIAKHKDIKLTGLGSDKEEVCAENWILIDKTPTGAKRFIDINSININGTIIEYKRLFVTSSPSGVNLIGINQVDCSSGMSRTSAIVIIKKDGTVLEKVEMSFDQSPFIHTPNDYIQLILNKNLCSDRKPLDLKTIRKNLLKIYNAP